MKDGVSVVVTAQYSEPVNLWGFNQRNFFLSKGFKLV